MKRHNLVKFVFKSACFSRKQILQFCNSFVFNFKHQTNEWWDFFEQGNSTILIWQKFS